MSRRVQIIGIPYGHGGVGEGCKLGPDAIRQAGLMEHVFPEEAGEGGYTSEERYVEFEGGGEEERVYDFGDIDVENFDDVDGAGDLDDFVNGKTEEQIVDEDEGKAKHLDEIAPMWNKVADEVADRIAEGNLPLIIGGDHTIATGTIRGSARNADGNIGIIWLDAHGDYNTPLSSPSGNVHGMPLAAALGRGPFDGVDWAKADNVEKENVALVGLRALDHGRPDWVEDEGLVDDGDVDTRTEAEAIAESDMTAMTMADIDEFGLEAVLEKAIEEAYGDGDIDGVHVSVDLDWLDSSEVKGVGTPVDQGATLREARRAMEILAEKNEEENGEFIRSIEFVETNPLIDTDGNRTAEIAAQLAGATFGEQFIYESDDDE